jgi:hypothetical protein
MSASEFHAKRLLLIRKSALSRRMSSGESGTEAYRTKNSFSTGCVRIINVALRRADELAQKIPVPDVLKKHLSQKDAAFIAVASAIPVPGTGLFAALIVGGKFSYKFLRNSSDHRPTVDASGVV